MYDHNIEEDLPKKKSYFLPEKISRQLRRIIPLRKEDAVNTFHLNILEMGIDVKTKILLEIGNKPNFIAQILSFEKHKFLNVSERMKFSVSISVHVSFRPSLGKWIGL